MDHPGRLLSLFRAVRSSVEPASEEKVVQSSIMGHPSVDQVLKTLPIPSLAVLLSHIRTWNATARTSNIAQSVLFALLKLRPADDITTALNGSNYDNELAPRKENMNVGGFVESMIPYTERHLMRVEKLVQDSWVVDFVLGEMDGGMYEADGDVHDFMDTD